MRSKKIAIVGSIAALSFAASPVAAVAATTHHSTPTVRTDRSLDKRDASHVDPTSDRGKADRSVETSDR